MEGSYKAVVAGADASPDASTVSGCATGATSAATSWSSSAHSFVDSHHDEPAYNDPVPKMPRPAYKNPIVRKLKVFVGGLPQGLQENDLKDYFNDFGDAVIEVEIKMDKVTGRSRGFGFVTLMNGDSTRLFNNKHRIKKKDIDVDEVTETKIFVGGLNPATGEQAVIDYFSKYGAIVNCELAFDHAGMSRGFAFVIFEDAEAVHRTLEACPTGHSIEDRMVDVRRAEPRKKLPNGQSLSQNMFGVPDLRQGGPIRNGSPQHSPAALTGTFLAVNGLSPTSTSSSTTCGSPTAASFMLEGRDGAPVQSYDPPFGVVGPHSGYGGYGGPSKAAYRKIKLAGPPGYGYEHGSGYGQSSAAGNEYIGACRFPLLSMNASPVRMDVSTFASAPY